MRCPEGPLPPRGAPSLCFLGGGSGLGGHKVKPGHCETMRPPVRRVPLHLKPNIRKKNTRGSETEGREALAGSPCRLEGEGAVTPQDPEARPSNPGTSALTLPYLLGAAPRVPRPSPPPRTARSRALAVGARSGRCSSTSAPRVESSSCCEARRRCALAPLRVAEGGGGEECVVRSVRCALRVPAPPPPRPPYPSVVLLRCLQSKKKTASGKQATA